MQEADSQQDRIETESVSHINCTECKADIDVSNFPSFSLINCPECGAKQVVPAQFGSFILLGRLGSGGMGVIYRAVDKELGRHVALKVMKKSLGENPEFVESFKHEARAAAALNHRNVVQIYSFGQHQGQPYIAMELVNGGRLDAMIAEEQQLDEVRALEIHIEVAEGLKAASEVGLVHGDVKPANILFGVNGEAKVVDFGLASFIGQQQDETGQIWGTPYYIAPEKARRQKHDFRSDIYSLGATLFHALAGEPPFDGPTPLEVVLARFNNPAPDIMEFREDLHPKTAAMVARMLEAAPTMRHPSYAALLYDMREALDAARVLPPSSTRSSVMGTAMPATSLGRRSPLAVGLIVLAGVLLVAGAVGGYIMHREHKSRIAAVAAEKRSFENAKTRGLKAFSSMTIMASAIFEIADKAKEPFNEINLTADTVEEAKKIAASAGEQMEKIQHVVGDTSNVMAKASDARCELEKASDFRTASGVANRLESLIGFLEENLKAASEALAAVDQGRMTASDLREKARVQAEAEQEKKRLAEEREREAVAKREAEKEAERLAEIEREKAELAREETVQHELDMLDGDRGANAQLIAQRKFAEAANSFELLASKLSTPESRLAHKSVVDSYKAMDKLKRFIIVSIGRSPYSQGWLLGDRRRDIVQADAAEGLKIALDEVGATVIPWSQVSLPHMLQIAGYYLEKTNLSEVEKADVLLSMSLLCYESGDFRRAEALAGMSCQIDPALQQEVDRLMPNLLSEGGAQ